MHAQRFQLCLLLPGHPARTLPGVDLELVFQPAAHNEAVHNKAAPGLQLRALPAIVQRLFEGGAILVPLGVQRFLHDAALLQRRPERLLHREGCAPGCFQLGAQSRRVGKALQTGVELGHRDTAADGQSPLQHQAAGGRVNRGADQHRRREPLLRQPHAGAVLLQGDGLGILPERFGTLQRGVVLTESKPPACGQRLRQQLGRSAAALHRRTQHRILVLQRVDLAGSVEVSDLGLHGLQGRFHGPEQRREPGGPGAVPGRPALGKGLGPCRCPGKECLGLIAKLRLIGRGQPQQNGTGAVGPQPGHDR